MAECTDCDNVKINPFVDEGDGVCSSCHGSGEAPWIDQVGADPDDPVSCKSCDGTGICSTCNGDGTV